ncbi:MAG TPA: bifunctional phosphopantothenoylcysteine decarboxylase/phosphopantothenate--cysteine ligase CoaBC [Segeticoccus sp.]|uniref:bifunctional phosphopantothenoylcysteine decarboxylase/phosphopantothenate--cysteine ligase CoaBC n=1 Tax=Segeticoccus sp. TaxID=2706531 RepID=UPI002D7EA48A|nr:bifunctional phosphopantothenoylcysteine decarboxylase/phosphopantothenate--cysteine ligase CoaBC [Segeticoccus sp.]HET8600633.1 bifunctional phosphopantothenoylcysteine decarboxylase/phosphopantothenate--cysteine ligase CoaBC [Segeticoccus sp.]
MRVVLGVSGGIAAYKACLLLRLFTEGGHDVTVVPTRAALEFVGAPTWAALSGKPVATDVWNEVHRVPHVRLGQHADLVVVAPATADLLARAAHGLADDLLTNTLLTARCPVVLTPAMHTEMWTHPATRANVATLRERGVHVIEPASGRLTGADTGPGRLPDPEDIYRACLQAAGGELARSGAATGPGPLSGRHVVVTAGGTREPLDPVRFIGNRSSGKQGIALAEVAARRGARVTLIAASVDVPLPTGVEVVRVETAVQLKDAVDKAAVDADVVVMAAAPADFRPAHYTDAKIKKSQLPGGAEDAPTIELTTNPDIVRGLVDARDGARSPLIVSFAAETGDAHGSVMDHARAKFARKGSDLQVVNEVGVGRTFGADESTVHILTRGSDAVVDAGPASKVSIAATVWDVVQKHLEPA